MLYRSWYTVDKKKLSINKLVIILVEKHSDVKMFHVWHYSNIIFVWEPVLCILSGNYYCSNKYIYIDNGRLLKLNSPFFFRWVPYKKFALNILGKCTIKNYFSRRSKRLSRNFVNLQIFKSKYQIVATTWRRLIFKSTKYIVLTK